VRNSDACLAKLSFVIDDGKDSCAYEYAFCRIATEPSNGYDSPGHDSCGAPTLHARYF
jgi:hypothetical protein